jgi:hypothetical protein
MFAWRYKRQSIHHLRIRCFDKQHRSTTAFDTLDGARKHDTQAIGAIAVRFAATIERSHTRVPCQSTRYLHNPMCSLHDEALSLSLSHSCIVAGSTDYWPREAYVLVEREDLASSLISYTERASSSTVVSATLGAVCDSDTAHTDDLPHVSSLSRMIFGKDLRLGEVQQLLQSTQHCTIRVQDTSVNELELV